MKLSRKKAIELCIELWTWLALTGKVKRKWPGWKKYKNWKGIKDAQSCWLCLYNNRKQKLPQIKSICARDCPYWKVYGFCAETNKPFAMWYDALTPQTRKKYAKLFLNQIKTLS